MDLRTGLPFWLDVNARRLDFPPLEEDLECDVAIVGAGITGALVALELARSGMSVAVLDGRDAARGSTAASTALLMAETDAEFLDLSERFGPAAAASVWRLGFDAIDRLRELCRSLPDDCGFADHDVLYLASDRRGFRRLQAESDARRRRGLEAELLDRRKLAAISSLAHAGALRSRGAVVDPYRLTISALERACEMGARVHDRTRVTGFRSASRGRRGVRLRTSRGTRVEAGHLVVAAGYESAAFLGFRRGGLRSTYVVATEPRASTPEGWPARSVLWETDRPYHYARPAAGHRCIAGGGDTPFRTDHRADGRLTRKSRQIVRQLRRWFPEANWELGSSWAGVFGESHDALPYIGPVPGADGVSAALGFGGNGVTFAAIAARLIGAERRGERPEDLALFALDR